MEGSSQKSTETSCLMEDSQPRAVYARRTWHFRCPDCNRTQIAKRSESHVDKCRMCGNEFTIVVRDKK